jgi:cytochrome c oxidase cbb3-type subunit 3
MSTKKPNGEKVETMGHVWDENLEELDNPLPNWWRWMFYITLIFGAVYLVLYPGLGSYSGVLNWTSTGQYEQEEQVAKEKYGPIFARFASQDIETISKDPKALGIGQRMFLNYCATCHGSDAGGGPGFPNLSDNSWLYGGTPQAIKTSIMEGRKGIMPPMGAALGGDEGIEQVTAYVMSLSGREADADLVAAGKEKFALCAGCHMPDGTGNQALGAPNLTDDTWLYGASPGIIKKTIREGRNGVMPAHKGFLGEDKSHIIAAYIYSLSNKP